MDDDKRIRPRPPVPFTSEIEGAPRETAAARRGREPVLPDPTSDPVAIANLTAQAGAAADPSASLDALRGANNVAPPGKGTSALGTYLDALGARETHAHAPKGGSSEVWGLSAALQHESISAADARVFAATGTLPDQGGKSGAERLAALEHAANAQGSWTAVNSLTFLVGMRRAVLASERASGKGSVEASLALDHQLAHGLQQTYARATHAREAKSAHALARASDLGAKAAATPDLVEKSKLNAEAEKLRNESAKGAYAEARYRASMPRSGFDAGSAFALAEEAQVTSARVEIASQQQIGMLAPSPPATLGDAKDAGNGVPGAKQVAREAKAAVGPSPTPAQRITLSRAEAHREGTVATFHAGRNRDAYIEARANQLGALEGQIRGHEQSGKTDTQSTLDEIDAHAAKRQIEDELGSVYAKASQTARSKGELAMARAALKENEKELPGALTSAQEGLAQANKQLEAAQDDNNVWVVDVRSDESKRRDQEAQYNRGVIAGAKSAALDRVKAAAAALPETAKRLDEAATSLEAESARAREDMARTSRVLGPRVGGLDTAGAYTQMRVYADADRAREEELLARVERPGTNTSAQVRQIVAARVDLARSYAQSATVEGVAKGREASAASARGLLANAQRSLGQADFQRSELAKDSTSREIATAMIVEGRADVAVAAAPFQPAITVSQLRVAEQATNEDLKGPAADAARARIGTAAVIGYARHDAVLVEVAREGNHDPKADDLLVAQGSRLLSNADPSAPGVPEARAILTKREESLKAVPVALRASAKELEDGGRAAMSSIRDLANSEGKLARGRVSSVAQGVAYGVSAGQSDVREVVTDAAEGRGRERANTVNSKTTELANGARGLARAFEQAGEEGRSSELLGALRIASDPALGQSVDPASRATFRDAVSSVSASAGGDATWYVAAGLRGAANAHGGYDAPASTLGQAVVGGSTLGVGTRVAPHLKGPSAYTTTRDASDAVAQQGQSLAEESGSWGYKAGNTVLETTLGAVVTRGVSAPAAVVSGFRAAHPVLDAMGVAVAYGAATSAASYVARRSFGAESWVANGVDLAASFAPFPTAKPAVSVGRAAFGVGKAAQIASTGVLLASNAAQAGATQVVVPWLADKSGLRSDAGRAAISIAVGALMAGGLTAASQGITRARAQSEVLARQLGALENVTPQKAEAARVELEKFLESTGSRIPSTTELVTLRSRLAVTLDAPTLKAGAGPLTLDAVVESIRVERACAETLREAGNPATLRSAELATVMKRAQERIDSSRGTASDPMAARDTLEAMAPTLAALPPESAKETIDRFAASAASTELPPATAPLPTKKSAGNGPPTNAPVWREGVRPVVEDLTKAGLEAIKRHQDVAIDIALHGFPPELNAAAKLSPTLRWQISALAAEGVKIEMGKPGGGYFSNRPMDGKGAYRVVLDPKQSPGDMTLGIAHEAAHVLYNMPKSVPFDTVSKRSYVSIQNGRSMIDEASSVFTELTVRHEILAAGGKDPGPVAGGSRYPWEAVYGAYARGEISRQVAVERMAEFVPKAQVSIDDHATYDVFYGRQWGARYDAHEIEAAPTMSRP